MKSRDSARDKEKIIWEAIPSCAKCHSLIKGIIEISEMIDKDKGKLKDWKKKICTRDKC